MEEEKETAVEGKEINEAESRISARLASLEAAPDAKEVDKIMEDTAQPVAPQVSKVNTGDLMSMVQADMDSKRGDVSATTIGRMLGLVTNNDFSLLEGKVDLIATRLNNIILKLEKANTILMGAPTGSDLERIDVQIGALRTMIREMLEDMQHDREKSLGRAKKPRMKIQTSKKPEIQAEVQETAPAEPESAGDAGDSSPAGEPVKQEGE